MAMSRVPRMDARLHTIVFKNEFKQKIDYTLYQAERFLKGCEIIRYNSNFKNFLAVALNVAKTLNEDQRGAGQVGIRPYALVQFQHIKSNKPGVTLLSYMLKKIYQQKPQILDFTEDFKHLTDVAQINLDGKQYW